MADESVSATTIIGASPEVIFAILADPAKHAAIDGTGWVAESPDDRPLTAVGQIFRMTMYHANHPDGNYEMANRIQVFRTAERHLVGTGPRRRRRQSALRWLDLALRPHARRPVGDESHAHL